MKESFNLNNLKKNIKKAIIYASVPLAVLTTAPLKVNAGDINSVLINKNLVSDLNRNPTPNPSQWEGGNALTLEQRIKPNDLIFVKDQEGKEALALKINCELKSFGQLGKLYDDVIKEKPELFPVEVVEKINNGGNFFNFSSHMQTEIEKANQHFLEYSNSEENLKQKEEKQAKHVHKILENGRLSFNELIKAMPEIFLAKKISTLNHEYGHSEEALEQGAKSTEIHLNPFLGGYFTFKGQVKNRAVVNAAGINTNKKYGEFLTDSLRGQNAPSQFLAIMALMAKSDGMTYVLATNFIKSFKNDPLNDLMQYSKETNTPLSELTLGLVADFILDRTNWPLLKIAMGEKGLVIPKSAIKPFYKLGESGPVVGLEGNWVF